MRQWWLWAALFCVKRIGCTVLPDAEVQVIQSNVIRLRLLTMRSGYLRNLKTGAGKRAEVRVRLYASEILMALGRSVRYRMGLV